MSTWEYFFVESEFLLLPKFAESLTEARVVSWLVEEGGRAHPGQPIVLVETDKTTIDVEVLFACTLEAILVPAGTVVAVGAPLARLGKAGMQQPPSEQRELGPTVLSMQVELSAMMEHRSRWQGERPEPLSYLLLAVGQAMEEHAGLAGGMDSPKHLSVGVFSKPGDLEGVVSFEPARTPVLVLDGMLRRMRTRPRSNGSLMRPPGLCVCAGSFSPERVLLGSSAAIAILLDLHEDETTGRLSIAASSRQPGLPELLQCLERHLREPVLFPRKDG